MQFSDRQFHCTDRVSNSRIEWMLIENYGPYQRVLDMDKALILSLFLCQEPYGIIEVVKIRSSKQVSVLSANIKPADCGTYSSAAVLILHNSSTWLRSSSRSHSRFLLQSKTPTINKNSQAIDMDRNLTWNYTLKKVHQQYNDVIFITVLPPTRNNITVSHLLTSRAIFSSVNIATFVSSFDLVPKNKQRKSVSSPTHPRVWRVSYHIRWDIGIWPFLLWLAL